MGVGCCKLHGGSTETHRIAAAVKMEDQLARSMLAKLGQPTPLGNPVDELLAIAAESRAWLTILRERVDALGETNLTYESYSEEGMTERERAVVLLYERAIDRTSRITASLIKLDLDARRVAIDEAQTEMLYRVLAAALTAVPKEYQQPARERLALALRAEDHE